MKRILPLLCIILLLSILSNAAPPSKQMKKADALFKEYNYSEAVQIYHKLADEGSKKAVRKIAECYLKMNDTENAEQFLAQVVAQQNVHPKYYFKYGQVLMSSYQYEQAKKWFQKYSELTPDDSRGEAMIKACDEASKLEYAAQPYEIFNLALNSSASDFGAVAYNGNRVVFTSSRGEGMLRKTDKWTNSSFLDIYIAPFTLDTSTVVERVKGVNTLNFHDGPACFDSAQTKIFFTRNNVVSGSAKSSRTGEVKLKIFMAEKDGNDGWKKPKELGFNGDEYSCAYPSVTNDGNTVYFTSDRAGGYGGKDIYKSTFNPKKEKWSRPVNLGSKVNTSGDERFPFIHQNGNLYFSSDGHGGFGGLDIFVATKDTSNKFTEIKNLGIPFNSPKDDFSFTTDKHFVRGFISSNRQGGKGDDDIYFFTKAIVPFEVNAMIQDTVKLEKGKIKIIDVQRRIFIEHGLTNAIGQFNTMIEPKRDYLIIVEKEGYKTIKYPLRTANNKKQIELSFNLEKEES